MGVVVTFGLNKLSHLQHVAQPFVLDNGPLVDSAELLVEGIGERTTGDSYFHAPIRVLEDLQVLANQSTVLGYVLKQEELAFVVQREILGDFAQFPPAEDQI